MDDTYEKAVDPVLERVMEDMQDDQTNAKEFAAYKKAIVRKKIKDRATGIARGRKIAQAAKFAKRKLRGTGKSKGKGRGTGKSKHWSEPPDTSTVPPSAPGDISASVQTATPQRSTTRPKKALKGANVNLQAEVVHEEAATDPEFLALQHQAYTVRMAVWSEWCSALHDDDIADAVIEALCKATSRGANVDEVAWEVADILRLTSSLMNDQLQKIAHQIAQDLSENDLLDVNGESERSLGPPAESPAESSK